MVLAVAVGDFGRVFMAMVATESAAREAADYGAFLGAAAWKASDAPWTTNDSEMRHRACTAMSQVPGFTDSDGTCTQNPAVSWELMTWDRASNTTVAADPLITDCSTIAQYADPCVVHVTATFVFRPVWPLPPVPSSITLTREAWFTISDLTGS